MRGYAGRRGFGIMVTEKRISWDLLKSEGLRNRPLRAPTTRGEVGRPSVASAERCILLRAARYGGQVSSSARSTYAKATVD